MSLRSFFVLDVASRLDKLRERQNRNKMRNKICDPFKMTDKDFVKSYRLSKALVRALIDDLCEVIPKERRNDAVTTQTKVLVALAFYASGSYQNIVGQSIYYYISQPSVSRAIKEVTEALNRPRIFKKYVYFPVTYQSRNNIKRGFYEKFKIPGVVGCIDGTHIGIIQPSLNEERFFNRKGYHSLNVMIICDADLNILCIDPSSPGSTHDSVVWRDHPLNNYLNEKYDNGEIIFLLGDSGYPLRKTMMTPILNAVDGTPDAYYCNMQVSARNTVERCIGILKTRFRCLLVARKLHYNPTTAGLIVNACAVLHNIAMRANLPVPNISQAEHLEGLWQINRPIQINPETSPNRNNLVNLHLQQGRQAQQALITWLWSEKQ